MAYEERTAVTTCIVTSGSKDARIQAVQSRLTEAFNCDISMASGPGNAKDPFLIHGLIAHVAFMQSDPAVFELGRQLYKALDQVDASAQVPFDRESFKSLTYRLHQISQDSDSLLSSAEVALTGIQCMQAAQMRLLESSSTKKKHEMAQSCSSSRYLQRAIEARKRWLLGAKSRKDTAMNLVSSRNDNCPARLSRSQLILSRGLAKVYNLVAQQDFEANLAIARDTKNDSSSMKTVATLTMVFLPASAVSSFFGMEFFNPGVGDIVISPYLWIFPVVTIPLTGMVFFIWWYWQRFHRGTDKKVVVVHGKSKTDSKYKAPKFKMWTKYASGVSSEKAESSQEVV
jgi:hypothetical protein